METESFIRKWKLIILTIEKNLKSDYSPYPYRVDEEDSSFEGILGERGVTNMGILDTLGGWVNDRLCIPWEWVEVILKEFYEELKNEKVNNMEEMETEVDNKKIEKVNEFAENLPVVLLRKWIGKAVTVHFIDGTKVKGKLLAYDKFMNISLEPRRYEEFIIRGSAIKKIEYP